MNDYTSPEDEIEKLVDQKRKQRAQRRAAVINLVTMARVHDGRPVDIASDHDADVTLVLMDLVETLVGGTPHKLDPLFQNAYTLSKRLLPVSVEVAVANSDHTKGE